MTHRRAIAHGVAHEIGDISVGKLADLVLWQPANFGVRPETVIKGGVIAWANVSASSSPPSTHILTVSLTAQQIGDANASIPTVQPVIGRPMWGSHAEAAALNSLLFVSKLSLDTGDL